MVGGKAAPKDGGKKAEGGKPKEAKGDKKGGITRSISMASKPFVFEVFVVKSVQKVTLSIIVLMCVTINYLWMI